MKQIDEMRNIFLNGQISKPEFIQAMYQGYHSKLFDYADYLKQTNISAIEITDGSVVMTSRDKGVKMVCPPGDYRVAPVEALNFLDYEAADSAMIMRLISPDDCVIDIGANMGWYAINIARRFPSVMVHAFEPIPKTFSFLERNLKLNQVENVVAYRLGLSNEAKDLTFYFFAQGSGNASSVNLSERRDAELVTCHVERLDDFVNEKKLRVNFIKCDIEGAEIFAFQGAIEILCRDKPIVFTEMLRKWAAKFNYHPNEIIALFVTLGYRCYYVHGAVLKELAKMTDETVETNFFFLHTDQHKCYLREMFKS